jgi:O-antigen/teichoic acid export membrane protein
LSEKKQPPAVRIRELLKKGSIALFEEGLFAASNFVIGVLLGRWMETADYGAFTTAHALFLLIAGAFYSAICVQPVLVFGARDYAARFAQYFACLLWMHAALAAIMSVALLAIAAFSWYRGSAILAQTFLALSLAGPFITLLWLARRAQYARLQPQWALLAGALYAPLIAGGIYLLYRLNWLSAPVSLVNMGAASLAASAPLIALIRPQRWQAGSDLTPRTVLLQHWRYGKWSGLTSCLRWSTNYAYYLILPLYLGLQASAELRAHMNLLLPILSANAALFGILIPQFAGLLAQPTHGEFWRFLRIVLALYAAAALLFWGLLVAFAEEIFALLYGGRYAADVHSLALLGLLPLGSGISGVLDSALFAAGRPKAATIGYVVSAVVTLTLGWALLAHNGVAGAGAGLLIASLATALSMAWLLVRTLKSEQSQSVDHSNL